MPYTKSAARSRASAKYNKKNYEFMSLTFNKGQKDLVKIAAERSGVSAGAYVREALYRRMEEEFPELEIRKLDSVSQEEE
ncbi:MAG: hypothetical protein Q4F31_09320 [Eubacteriales bacterium]|nr:hypothetical protein [Eubacteriales bacterium]